MERKQIETIDGIKGEYEIDSRFSAYIWMTYPYELKVYIELPSGTLGDEKEIEDLVSHDLQYLLKCIETIELNFDEFERLSINYSALDSGLYIQMFNKKFYSSYEEERYMQELKIRLKEGYNELYDKYITNPDHLYKTFKNKIAPSILSTLIKTIQKKREKIMNKDGANDVNVTNEE